MQALLDKLGHKGHSAWWILVELCAEKLEKKADEEFTAAHCKFVFNRRYLRENLRLSDAKVTSTLQVLAECSLLAGDLVKDEWHIEMPKLLECLDRDVARARKPRALARQEEEKEEEKEEEVGGGGNQKVSDAKRQEIRFRLAKEIREVESWLEPLFGGPIPGKTKRHIPDMLILCSGDVTEVRKVLEDLYQSPKIRTGEGLNGSKASYIAAAIANRFGFGSDA